MTAARYIALPETCDHEALTAALGDAFVLEAEGAVTHRRRFLETFDWRLWRQDRLLYREADRYSLMRRSDGCRLETGPAAAPSAKLFTADLPPGALRDALTPLLEMRALLQLMDLSLSVRTFVLRNGDLKIVVRGGWAGVRAGRRRAGGEPAPFLRLEPVRGYDDELPRVERVLAEQGIDPQPVDLPVWALSHVGLEGRSYSSKIDVTLAADTPSREAVRRILAQQLRVMRQNRNGIISDVDSEFLHDFRVAVRRTRSALTLLKGVLPPTVARRFRREFTVLGKATNRLRDLDVYLLQEHAYRRLVPAGLHDGLDLLFADFAAERRREQRRVARLLQSEDFAKLREDWGRYLAGDDPADAEPSRRADLPVRDLACRRISKQVRRIWKRGAAIDDGSPDSDLHDLRLEAKKLRYLLEFFAGLFPAGRTKPLIKQLKLLQENLGDFNDLCVQQDALDAFLESRVGDGARGRRTAAAIGGLIVALNARQLDVRRHFAEAFAAFASERNRKRYAELFRQERAKEAQA